MEKVFQELIMYMETKKPFVMARIIEAQGSVPRKEGATMILKENGYFSGTVGGGAAEHEACNDAKYAMDSKTSFIKEYVSNTQSDAGRQDAGMICGGKIKVEFRYVKANDEESYQEIRAWIDSLKKQAVNLYIYGAGHVAQALVPVAATVGFSCIVMDDRPELLNKTLFPAATELKLIDYTKLGDVLDVNEDDFVCIMTKGHKDDFYVLEPAMRSKAFYIGMLGSKKKVASLHKMLQEDGFSKERIADCHSPIGLPILAETPDEIAISIVGELIYYRSIMNQSRGLK